MSDFNIIYELIKRGEDEQLDFKQHITSPSKIAKTIVAFANTEGGQIVIGVDDQGEIRGVDVEQEKYMMIKAGKRYCDPSVFIYFTVLETKEADVLIATIKKSRRSDHSALTESGDWLPYIRIADQSIVVPGMDDQLLSDKYNADPIPILWDENKGLLNYLRENEFISIKEYMKMMNISYTVAKRSLRDLVEHDVLDREYINNLPYYCLKNSK